MHVCAAHMYSLHLVDYKFVCKLCICALLISFKRSFLMAPSACQISKPNRVGQPLAQHTAYTTHTTYTAHTPHIATVAILNHIPSHDWPNITAAICGGRAPLMQLRSDDAGAAGNPLPRPPPKINIIVPSLNSSIGSISSSCSTKVLSWLSSGCCRAKRQARCEQLHEAPEERLALSAPFGAPSMWIGLDGIVQAASITSC